MCLVTISQKILFANFLFNMQENKIDRRPKFLCYSLNVVGVIRPSVLALSDFSSIKGKEMRERKASDHSAFPDACYCLESCISTKIR